MPPQRIEFLTVTWDREARRDACAKATVRTLARVTLDSLHAVRQFANEVISDIFLCELARTRATHASARTRAHARDARTSHFGQSMADARLRAMPRQQTSNRSSAVPCSAV